MRKSNIFLIIAILIFIAYYYIKIVKKTDDRSKKETIERVSSYDRKEWGKWIDADNDGLNTRQEVLFEESLINPKVENNKVVSGRWYDKFSGEYFNDPKDLDVDHFVPLKNAYESGGSNWSKKKKEEYYNYLKSENHLIAVSKRMNRSKGDKGPTKWLPPNEEYQCEYVRTWYRIKTDWGLTLEEGFDDVSNRVCRGK